MYPSRFFEKNKGLYYDNLMAVRQKNDMLQWLKYFLVGIEQTAALAVGVLINILALKAALEENLHANFGRRTASAQRLLNALFKHPAVSVEDVQQICGTSYKASNDLVSQMCACGILREITQQSRNRSLRGGKPSSPQKR